jgi:Leucine-rich repeat (LRR) protein
MQSGFNRILNLNMLSAKKLYIIARYINIDFMNFIKTLTEIEYLEFWNDDLMEYSINIRDIINNMRNLRKLIIFDCACTIVINDDSFHGFNKLTNLSLMHCNITSSEPFERIPNLEKLYIRFDDCDYSDYNDYKSRIESLLVKFARHLLTKNTSLVKFTCF